LIGRSEILAQSRRHSDRIWAVEGCTGIRRHLAQRLMADGESVLDAPAKLSARTGCSPPGRADATDAHSVAVALCTPEAVCWSPS
jgi:hypothetical protein